MERQEILDGLNEALEEMFNDPTIQVEEDNTLEEIMKWAHLTVDGLAEAIEDQFDVVLDTDSLEEMDRISALVDLLQQEI